MSNSAGLPTPRPGRPCVGLDHEFLDGGQETGTQGCDSSEKRVSFVHLGSRPGRGDSALRARAARVPGRGSHWALQSGGERSRDVGDSSRRSGDGQAAVLSEGYGRLLKHLSGPVDGGSGPRSVRDPRAGGRPAVSPVAAMPDSWFSFRVSPSTATAIAWDAGRVGTTVCWAAWMPACHGSLWPMNSSCWRKCPWNRGICRSTPS